MARSSVPVLLASFLLPLAPLQAAGPASLVADINTTEVPFGGGNARIQGGLLPLDDRILFVVASGLWVSDGTDAGTKLLRDFCPGGCSSNPELLGRTGGVAVFRIEIDEPGAGIQTGFWRTDGTREGTAAFKTPVLSAPPREPDGSRPCSQALSPATCGSSRPGMAR